ncbi:tumor susceptibility gene 101 protein-like [Dreissena polymorpha]|uniref:tumor susceptibility gene 101 protein-like n=1 Tax=Dreissena polymorpha TaxID=45954 RepID=UPI0022640605|nr:tumor susceptibility gene 101 protein-like [Dreissena polymorpha]
MSSIEQFLKSALMKYKHPEKAKKDVLSAIKKFETLSPKYEAFVLNDCSSRELLQLDGTIPVTYKGAVTNIPICICLMDTHPYDPPIVFVKPTSTMAIRSGRNVNTNGKVDLPYLREWNYPNSDLLGLLQILSIVFGEEPPLYARQEAINQPPPPVYPRTQPTNQTPPPVPARSQPSKLTPPPRYPTKRTPNPHAGAGSVAWA